VRNPGGPASHAGRGEDARFWLDRDLGGLELLRATYVEHRFSRHAHEGFAIGVIESGVEATDLRAFTGGLKERVLMPGGTVAAINPGEVHTGHAAREAGWWTYRMLYPKPEVLARVASELAGEEREAPFFPEPVIHDYALVREILGLHAALEDPATPSLEREELLFSALARLILRHSGDRPGGRAAGRERRAVRAAREYLEANFAGDVSLDSLARECGLSPFHLTRTFSRELGAPPHVYLTRVRLDHAKRLLAAGVPAGEVAATAGFADQSHLTRRFKGWFGVTPGRYAASVAPASAA